MNAQGLMINVQRLASAEQVTEKIYGLTFLDPSTKLRTSSRKVTKETYIPSFLLIEKKQEVKAAKNAFTFLDTRKVTKEYALLKELLKFCCVPLRQNNLLRFEQILSFNTSLHIIFIRNSFNEQRKRKNKLFIKEWEC